MNPHDPAKPSTEAARHLLAWAASGGHIRQVDSIVLRDFDANEDEPRLLHIIPIGEAIGFAITTSRAAPDDKDILWVSSVGLAGAIGALGFGVVPGAALVPPRFATPDYKPETKP